MSHSPMSYIDPERTHVTLLDFPPDKSIAGHAADRDPGNLARRVKTEQEASCISAWEDELHNIEGLIDDMAGLHNLSAEWR